MLGAFLIPIAMSSLRGLTHVLTCKEESATPFTLMLFEDQPPQLLSSTRIEAGDDEFFCSDETGGLSLNMGAKSLPDGRVAMVLPITNNSEHVWQGTITLEVGGATFPASLGEIPAGDTKTETIPLNLDPGTTDVDGQLLIGP